MTAQPVTHISAEAYLLMEKDSEVKHELFFGERYAMAGASRMHNLIAANIAREIGNRLKSGPCEVYQSDMRVRVGGDSYAYPDVVVACGELRFEQEQGLETLLTPTVIVEVLSPSTADWDRGGKFVLYRSLPSLQTYVLVAVDRPHVELFERTEEGWLLTEHEGREAGLNLDEAVGCRLPLAEVYAKVAWEEER